MGWSHHAFTCHFYYLNKQWRKWKYLQGKKKKKQLSFEGSDQKFYLSPSICRQTTLIFQVVLCHVYAQSHTCKRRNWEKDNSSGLSGFGDTALETIPKFSWLYVYAASLIHGNFHHCFLSAVIPCPPVPEVKLAMLSKPHKQCIAGEVRKRDKAHTFWNTF